MTNSNLIEEVAAAQAACDAIRADMRAMMSLRNPRGRNLKAALRACQSALNTAEERALRAIIAENPAGNDRVTATLIMDARVGIHNREARLARGDA